MECLGNSRGHNAYDAGVPVLAREDNALSVGVVKTLLSNHFAGLFEYFAFALLAESVLLLEVLCDFRRAGIAIACEQLNGQAGVAHSAGGIEHWCKSKADVETVEPLSGKVSRFD